MRVIGSFSKGLKILSHLASHDGARLSDIAAAFDMPASNMTLFLNSLMSEGFAVKDADGYHLTARIGELANTAAGCFSELKRVTSGIIHELHERFDENVLLGVLSGDRLLFIERLQSSRPVQIINDATISYLPHVTAAGKAIIAFWDEARLDEYLSGTPLTKYTDRTITVKATLREELAAVKKNGYALNRGEYEEAIMAASVPVFLDGPIASITVQFPSFRYSERDLERHAQEMLKCRSDRLRRVR